MLRAADADALPMRFGDLADSVERYVSDIEKLADGERENSRKLRQLIDQGAFKLAADPETAYAPPPSPDDVPQFDFSALKRAAQRLKKSAANYDDAFEGALASDFRLPPAELAHLNGLLQGLEQTLTSPTPGTGRPLKVTRPWCSTAAKGNSATNKRRQILADRARLALYEVRNPGFLRRRPQPAQSDVLTSYRLPSARNVDLA